VLDWRDNQPHHDIVWVF